MCHLQLYYGSDNMGKEHGNFQHITSIYGPRALPSIQSPS